MGLLTEEQERAVSQRAAQLLDFIGAEGEKNVVRKRRIGVAARNAEAVLAIARCFARCIAELEVRVRELEGR